VTVLGSTKGLLPKTNELVLDSGFVLDTEEVEQRLTDGYTLPAEFYYDSRIYRLEQELLFRRSWHFAGLEREVARIGDFLTTSVAGVPLVVVRDRDGVLRAHVNVCRHRGHAVAVGQGNRKTLQCAYHGWTYNLSGCLHSVPRSDEGQFDLREFGLLPAYVDTWAGTVFVSLEPKDELTNALGELPQVMEETGYDFPFASDTGLTLYNRTEMRLQCNWKVAWENALECYHCSTIHKNSFAEYYQLDGEGYVNGNCDRGAYSLCYFKKGIGERFGITGNSQPAITFYWFFPGTSFSGGIQSGGATLSRFLPLGPEECLRVFYTYTRPGADDSEMAELADATRRTLEEDVEVVARVQEGLRSGMVRFGKTMPQSEANIRHFHRLTWDTLAPAFVIDPGGNEQPVSDG
jgi:phenylpropionate dioxygenase-like ring-hydroxylating dioxygenase large terminal subunit